MSTLQVDNFEHRATGDNVPAEYVVHGSAKTWINFNGTGTVAIRDSLNISSLVDVSTGRYSFNYTHVFSTNGYSAGGLTQSRTLEAAGAQWMSSSLEVVTRDGSGSGVDTNAASISCVGELA